MTHTVTRQCAAVFAMRVPFCLDEQRTTYVHTLFGRRPVLFLPNEAARQKRTSCMTKAKIRATPIPDAQTQKYIYCSLQRLLFLQDIRLPRRHIADLSIFRPW